MNIFYLLLFEIEVFNFLAKSVSLVTDRCFEQGKGLKYESGVHWKELSDINILLLSIKSYLTPLYIIIIKSNQQLYLFESFHKFLLVIIICNALNSC